uniref:Uncharacterized protein n=2 Tax=Guillardia theta TaxID=55529 RepID=A0A6U6DG51_GUITH|mmetsp:Transcript_5776/g.20451  ORF Transcript_5776/g.20451 Transcript_5776/m.20451 type:complete len:163 (+) Transcript_5776:580-1068(+)
MQEETSRIENDPADTGITVWVFISFFPTCLSSYFGNRMEPWPWRGFSVQTRVSYRGRIFLNLALVQGCWDASARGLSCGMPSGVLLNVVPCRLDCETMIMTDLKQVLPRLHVASKINCRGRNVVVKTLEWGKSTDEDHIMDTLENIAPDVWFRSNFMQDMTV